MPSNLPAPPAREVKLRVFGYAGVERARSNGRDPIRGQAKHLALLIYLAVSKRGDFVAREDLLALLWPDADQDHARASLRQGLSCIRRTVGSHVVRTNGRHTVGLDREMIWCDAREFERLIDEGRPQDALQLYRGHFAEGFHISAGEAFEEWIEARRVHYRRRAVDAAWWLADRGEAQGLGTEAAFWGKRAVGLAGSDELQIQRLLALLHRVGDITGAARAYRGLVEYLAREWKAAPSPETERLFDQIRKSAVRSDDVFGSPQGRRLSDRRSGGERRSAEAGCVPPFPDRRTGGDRRCHTERRSGLDRRAAVEPLGAS